MNQVQDTVNPLLPKIRVRNVLVACLSLLHRKFSIRLNQLVIHCKRHMKVLDT